jgi:hypothetical protein
MGFADPGLKARGSLPVHRFGGSQAPDGDIISGEVGLYLCGVRILRTEALFRDTQCPAVNGLGVFRAGSGDNLSQIVQRADQVQVFAPE